MPRFAPAAQFALTPAGATARAHGLRIERAPTGFAFYPANSASGRSSGSPRPPLAVRDVGEAGTAQKCVMARQEPRRPTFSRFEAPASSKLTRGIDSPREALLEGVSSQRLGRAPHGVRPFWGAR